jgi:hypothetical protein
VKERTTYFPRRESNRTPPGYVTVLLRIEQEEEKKTEELKVNESDSHDREREKNSDKMKTRRNGRRIRRGQDERT